jgi:6-phosphogluconolactonase (cycloisomerase 2 family)
MSIRRVIAVIAGTVTAATVGLGLTAAPAGAATPAPQIHRAVPGPVGSLLGADRAAVFVQTNDQTANAVIVFGRGRDGRLTQLGSYPTGGRGGAEPGAVVDPLASQGSLTYDRDHRLLYAVNAGSDTITVFAVHGQALRRMQVLPSGGHLPVSIGRADDVVYVLNAGGDGTIQGYRVRGRGLQAIPDSTRSLGLGNPAAPPFLASPSQVALTPDGRTVIVATKTHATLVAFPLDRAGRPAGDPVVTGTGAGTVPFALSFDPAGRLQVADATGGVYSYAVHHDGSLAPVSPFVANGQAATCWSVSVGRFLYVANAGSATVTGYRTDHNGQLALLDPSGVSAQTGAGPVDLAASSDGRFLYQQATGAGAIDEFRIGADGSLTLIGTVAGLPVDNGSGPEGIAAS